MGLSALDCTKCGARLEYEEGTSAITCRYCQTAHQLQVPAAAVPTSDSLRVMAERSIAGSEFGKAMQLIEQGLSIDPDHVQLLALETAAKKGLASLAANQEAQDTEELQQSAELVEAQQYYMQAF